MGWDIACYVFGVIAVVGPLCLVPWYFVTARKKLRALGTGNGSGEPESSESGTEGRE